MSIIKFESTGKVENLKNILREISLENIIILSTEKNNISTDEYNNLLAEFADTKKITGGVFPLVIFENKHYEIGTVVIALSMDMNIHVVENLSTSDDFVEDIEEFADLDYQGKTNIVFVDGLSANIGGFIDEVFNIVGVFQNFIGGGAGSLSFEQKPVILTPNGIKKDCAVILNIDLESYIGVSHGWKSISGPHQVTKSDKNKIIELDYKPALQVYKSVVEPHNNNIKITEENFFEVAKGYPFGINKFDSEKIVRDPIFLENNSLVCVGEVNQGDYVDILNGDNALLIEAAKHAKDISLQAIENTSDISNKNSFALFIDCISRVLFLEEDFSKELNNVKIDNIPMVGALTLGEIANNGNDYLEFYNKTSVFGLLKK
jgi:hypothetical protein